MRARDNPFSTDRILKIRYRPRGWTWDEMLERLARLNYRAAIVGPEGHGKTTLMEDLEPHLRARGFGVRHLRLTREQPAFDPSWLRDVIGATTSKDVLLFDGAEQLTRIAWWRFRRMARKAGGLVITSHRPGMLPTLVECETDEDLLGGIVRDLAPGRPDDAAEDARALFARHGGNVREALRELYDRYAADS
jgi:hypothetical protein